MKGRTNKAKENVSGHPLERLWKAAGYASADELAQACGMQPESIRKINWGYRGVSVDTMLKLSEALRVRSSTVLAAVRQAKKRLLTTVK